MVLFAVLLQAVIFQFYAQAAKHLREKGISSLQILAYERYALYPSALALLYFWDSGSFYFLLSHTQVLLIFLGFLFTQSIFSYFYFVSRHMTHSLTFVSAFLNALGLPLLLIGGVFINHDTPTLYEVAGIILLVIAVFLKPSRSEKKSENGQLLHSIPVILFISLSYLLLQSIKDPLYRAFLTGMPTVWFSVALYMFCASLFINIFFVFKKMPDEKFLENGKIKWLVVAIPALWFLGSLPEGYSFANLPVYTLVAISMINFLMSFSSDLYNHRIRLSARTIIFGLLTISGVALNIVGRFVR